MATSAAAAASTAPDKKSHAKTLDTQLRAGVRTQTVSDLEIGQVLKTIRDEELWAELGAATFEEYCSTVAGLGLKRVSSRIRIFEAYGKYELKPDELIPSTKLRILMPVVTKVNVRGWLKQAATMSCAELVATVREERKKLQKPGKKLRNDPQVHVMGIGFTKQDYATVKRAIDLGKHKLGAKTIGEALTVVLKRGLATLDRKARR